MNIKVILIASAAAYAKAGISQIPDDDFFTELNAWLEKELNA